jgi:hypothetical protein
MKGTSKSIINGIIVSLFFIIPYVFSLLLMMYVPNGKDDSDLAFALIWAILGNNLLIPDILIKTDLPVPSQPLIIICILVVINIVIKIICTHKPTIFNVMS